MLIVAELTEVAAPLIGKQNSVCDETISCFSVCLLGGHCFGLHAALNYDEVAVH